MRFKRSILSGLFITALAVVALFPGGALAQTGLRVTFSVSPTALPVGSLAHAMLSVSCISNTPLMLSPGDTFSFILDPSVSTKTLIATLPSVSSANLVATDFSAAAPSATQVVITYNGQSKSFSYGDTVSVEVALLTGGQVVTGKISFSSRFTGSVNGNLPYTTVSLVNFAPGEVSSVVHDATLVGTGSSNLPLGVAVPLTLSGAASDSTNAVLDVTNTVGSANLPVAIKAQGASGGVMGNAMEAEGGDGNNGGIGFIAVGGNSSAAIGGGGFGGNGIEAFGGFASGAGNVAGNGITARGGQGQGGTDGLAGEFQGDVDVQGHLSKTSGSFKIDHPLDPAKKYLYHSFVESPDMMNIYNGNVTTDASGEATITLPDWFEALNRDFRYQLTVIGQFAQAIVSSKVKGNRFTIRTSVPGIEVSWQVTGIRQDAWADAHRIPVEQDKPERERGYYLHPSLFNQPEEKGLEWARNPRLMQQLKEKREKAAMRAAGGGR
jgi:hypothetical protein